MSYLLHEGDGQRRGPDGAEAVAEPGEDPGEEAEAGAGWAGAAGRHRPTGELVGPHQIRGILAIQASQSPLFPSPNF